MVYNFILLLVNELLFTLLCKIYFTYTQVSIREALIKARGPGQGPCSPPRCAGPAYFCDRRRLYGGQRGKKTFF